MKFKASFATLAVVVGMICAGSAVQALGQGACCIESGCAQVESEAECSDLNGYYLPGADCSTNACGEGACCAGPACVMTDAYTCLMGGRDFMGVGTDCIDDPCGFGAGACCVDGNCAVMSPEDCATAGGVYLIAGSNCVSDPCAEGACCAPGLCLDTIQWECDGADGTFLGGDTCANDPCAQEYDCPLNSLFGQSRDEPDFFVSYTSEETPGYLRSERFWSLPGPVAELTWWGFDLHFTGSGWQDCVESDLSFAITFREDDDGIPGATVCSHVVTATRTPTGMEYLGQILNEYHAVLPQPCTLVHGWVSIVGLGDADCWFLWVSSFEGDNLSYCEGCQDLFTPRDHALCLLGLAGGVFGACCDDGSGYCEEDAEIDACTDLDDRFLPEGECGDLDPECGIFTGACCFGDGSCQPLTPEEDCTNQGGTWLGAGTNCATDPCRPGACCVPGDCYEMIRFDCAPISRVFIEDVGCTPDPCAPEPCPLDALYGQSADDPFGFNSYTSEESAGFRFYDDFVAVAGPVEEITWWGFDLHWDGSNWYECEETDNTFEISFHENAGGWPGATVCSYTLTASRTPTGINYLGAELNEYHVTLPESCVLVNGWLSLVGLGDPACRFLWQSSGDGTGTSYCDGCQAPWNSDDLSFCLDGTEGGVLGACCDESTGNCADDQDITLCLGADDLFAPGTTCTSLEPACGVIEGACCFDDGSCSIELEADCAPLGGDWLGGYTLCEYCPCTIACRPGASMEGEPDCHEGYVDEYNGGCDAETQVFTPLELCQTVCGRGGVFFGGENWQADYDWYEVSIPEPMQLTWRVEGEFPLGAWIVDGNLGCEGAVVIAAQGALECDRAEASVLVEPGTYWLVVGAIAQTDSAACGAQYNAVAFGDVPCAGDMNFDGELDLDDLTLFVECITGPGGGVNPGCPPANSDFDDDVDLVDCAAFLDFFTGGAT